MKIEQKENTNENTVYHKHSHSCLSNFQGSIYRTFSSIYHATFSQCNKENLNDLKTRSQVLDNF